MQMENRSIHQLQRRIVQEVRLWHFFNGAVAVLQTLVIALGAEISSVYLGAINLEVTATTALVPSLQGMKRLMAGSRVALIGTTLNLPLLLSVQLSESCRAKIPTGRKLPVA